MTLQRQMIFWVAALLAFVLLLYIFSAILLPFVAGFALAYFLDPVADWLQRRGLNRLIATLVILLLFVLTFVAVLLGLAPTLSDQVSRFAERLPGYVSDLITLFQSAAPEWLKDALSQPEQGLPSSVSNVATTAAGWFGSLLGSLWSGGLALVNIVSLLVITPIVAFYMLNDWDRMVAKMDSLLPRDHAETIRTLAREMDMAVAGFIRGQGLLCLLLGAFYAASLSIIGLSFGLLIGLTAGILSFIPFVGSITGFVLSVGMGLVQFWPEWTMVLIVLGIFAFGQFVEGNFLQPLLVGDRVGLHPVWLMFALFAFGYLFGFVGLLLAVPLAACVGVLARYAVRRYKESALYLGGPEKAAGAAGMRKASAPRRRTKSG